MTNLNGKLLLKVLLTLLLKMCTCCLSSDTFVTVKLVIRFFTHTLCPELIMSLMYGIAAVMYISKKLKAVHKRAVKVLCAASPVLTGRGHISHCPLPSKEHLQYNKCILVHKVIHNKSPQYLRQLVQVGALSDHSSWNSILILPQKRIDIYKMSFAYSGFFCWNVLPKSLKMVCSVSTFKSKALQHFRTECKTYVFSFETVQYLVS